jgi:hypothetical protein
LAGELAYLGDRSRGSMLRDVGPPTMQVGVDG